MPDDTLKRLLIKLGLDTRDFKQVVQEVRRELKRTNDEARSSAAQATAQQKQHNVLVRQEIDDQRKLQAEARTMAEVDRAKLTWRRSQQEATKQEIRQRELETAEIKKQHTAEINLLKLDQERLRTAQMQYRLSQQQAREAERQSRTTAGGGLFGRVAQAVTGSSLAGAVAGGVAVGGIVTGAAIGLIEQAREKVHQLAQALMEASGPAQTLRVEFERLTQRAAADPEKVLSGLRQATRGLVSDMELYKIANNFLRQNIHVTTDQMALLVQNTVNLARSMNKSAPEAAAALERAFINPQRGMMLLARTTGISMEALMRTMRGLPHTMDPATRATIMFNEILKQEEIMLQRVGVPATTLPELIQQIHTSEKNFVEDMARGVLKGGEFGKTVEDLSAKLRNLQPVLQAAAEWLGVKLLNGMHLAIDSGKTLAGTIDNISGALLKLVVHLREYAKNFAAFYEGTETFNFSKMFKSFSANADEAAASLAKINKETAEMIDNLDIFGEKAAAQAKAADPFGLHGMMSRLGLQNTPPGTETPPGATPQEQQRLAQQRMQLQQLQDKLELDEFRQRMAEQERLTKHQYDTGIIALAAYTDKQKALKEEEYQASVNRLRKDLAATLSNIKTKTEVEIGGDVFPTRSAQEKANMQQLAKRKENIAEVDLKTKHDAEISAIDDKNLNDRLAAFKAYTDAINKMQLSGVKERTSILEKEFQQGLVGADDYISQRQMLIAEEYRLTIDGLEARKKAAKDNQQEIATINSEESQAEVSRQIALTNFLEQQDDIRLKALQSRYAQAKKYLETEVAIGGAAPGGEALKSTATEQLLLLTRAHMQELLNEQTQLESSSDRNWEAWVKVKEEIASTVQEQVKLNQELARMRDTAAPIASIFGSLASVLGQFRGAGAVGVTAAFENVSKSLQQVSQFTEANRAMMAQTGQGLFQSFGTSVRSLFSRGGITARPETALQIFEGSTRKGSAAIESFSTMITTNVQKLREFAAALDKSITVVGPKGLRETHQAGGLVGPGGGVAGPGEYVIPAPAVPSWMGMGTGRPADYALSKTPDIIQEFNQRLQDSVKIVPTFADKLTDVSEKMKGIAAGIAGAFQGMMGGKTGAGGALGGAAGLSQLGGSIGMMFGPLGSAVGLGVGGALGGITGGIFGAKEKQLQQDLHKITDQMQSIIDSMNEGAITLSQAISDLRNERQQALRILSQDPKGGKGGGKGGKKGYSPTQAQQMIDQIDSQIAQLVNTQKQLLDQLNQQVAILANPLPFQQYVQSLDQIITKYQQFASAAQGNAQEVANAQLYLNESLQAYVQTLSQQLNQAQQQAIQDALTLLNLEYQRQQIINQEAQQEYDILTQGVLTRQRTTAMTKGQQIGVLRYNEQQQLMQIDEQIALQQYKVQTEQQIFQIATTRIGLETQLLSLQENAAGVQNQQTAALLQVVQQLQAAMASGTLQQQIGALSAGGAPATGTGLLTTILGTLGLGGYVPPGVLTGVGGATNYLAQFPQPYQSAINFINNLDPNFMQNLWNAMQTPPGSFQRQAAVSEAAPYQQDLNTSGFDFGSLKSWIQTGAEISGTTATVTNAPVATGPAGLPPGTAFGQPTAPGIAPSTIAPSTSAGGTPFGAVTSATPYSTLGDSMASLGTNTDAVTTSFDALNKNVTALTTALTNLMNTVGISPVTGNFISTVGGNNFEALLNAIYETRGRYGSAGFRREYL